MAAKRRRAEPTRRKDAAGRWRDARGRYASPPRRGQAYRDASGHRRTVPKKRPPLPPPPKKRKKRAPDPLAAIAGHLDVGYSGSIAAGVVEFDLSERPFLYAELSPAVERAADDPTVIAAPEIRCQALIAIVSPDLGDFWLAGPFTISISLALSQLAGDMTEWAERYDETTVVGITLVFPDLAPEPER